jgi:hypothetical protein
MKQFKDYFPMKDYHTQNVVGAYTWLGQRGYETEVQNIRTNPNLGQPYLRRRALVGLIYEKSLINDFLSSCWTQGNLTDRLKKMDEWHRLLKNCLSHVKEDRRHAYKKREI